MPTITHKTLGYVEYEAGELQNVSDISFPGLEYCVTIETAEQIVRLTEDTQACFNSEHRVCYVILHESPGTARLMKINKVVFYGRDLDLFHKRLWV